MKLTGYSRLSKDLVIKEIKQALEKQPSFFVADHSNLSASLLDKLRAKLRKENSRYVAVKNSLGRRVLEGADLKDLTSHMNGKCGLVFVDKDPVSSSKVLVDFAKENETFKVQAGYVNGQVVSLAQIKELASLPSKQVLLSKMLGGMQAPISGFVGVLSGTLRKLVTALDAVAKKKSGS